MVLCNTIDKFKIVFYYLLEKYIINCKYSCTVIYLSFYNYYFKNIFLHNLGNKGYKMYFKKNYILNNYS